MTNQEFEQTCQDICPHCKAGNVARQRVDTKEWVHDSLSGKGFGSHTICMATHFRNTHKDLLSG